MARQGERFPSRSEGGNMGREGEQRRGKAVSSQSGDPCSR